MNHANDSAFRSHDHDQEDDQLDFTDSSSMFRDFPGLSQVPRIMTNSIATFKSRHIRFVFARHSLGVVLIAVTISLWTASNFLASSIFADDSYSKPYFVTWLNISFFSLFLIRPLMKNAWRYFCEKVPMLRRRRQPGASQIIYSPVGASSRESLAKPDDVEEGYDDRDSDHTVAGPREAMFLDESMVLSSYGFSEHVLKKMTLRETARLSLGFLFLWFSSNYFISACLQYTTVASSTVINTTSAVFTLAIGVCMGVERFTVRKLVGVAVCLLGVIIISRVDLSGKSDENRGSFPEKTALEMAFGDILALLASLCYAIYTLMLKKRVGDESRIDVFSFFGFIGLFDFLLLWPGLIVLHYAGLEKFELPPDGKIWWVIAINGALSLISDVCFTYSMLLTSPLVVAVGVSLSIPLSLLGQMVINGQSSSALYWVGSIIVVISFILINEESKHDEEHADEIRASRMLTVDDFLET